MAQIVVTGASAVCTFGTAPGTINATSQTVCMAEGKPIATIQDCQPGSITPFGMCTSMANPQVAAATAAALGVLTPQPCVCVPAGTWIPTKPAVLINKKPCLTNDCTLMCSNGAGVISITAPGQTKAAIT